MGVTYFQDFKRDNGLPVTVEYSFSPGSPTTYSPRFGADGGDPCEVSLVSVWPDTPWHHWLAGVSNRMWSGWRHRFQWFPRALMRIDEWWRASLTVSERERMEAWLAEHHVEEPYEPEDY